MNETKMRDAARQRLVDAELAAVLAVPVARVVASPARGTSRFAMAATILFGLCVALGVAWLRAHDRDEAQEPVYDPVFPWHEEEVSLSLPRDRFVVLRDANEAANTPLAANAVAVLPTLDPELLAVLARRPEVRRVSVGASASSRFTREVWQAIAALPALEMLVVGAEFQEPGGPPSVTAEGLRELRRCAHLRSLTLLGSHECVLDADIGRALAELPRLRCLVLGGRTMTGEGLAALGQLPLLRLLALSSLEPFDAEAGIALQKLRSLESLFVQNRAEDMALSTEFVQALRPMRALRELHLFGRMQPAALHSLPPNLESLNVFGGLHANDVRALLQLPKLRSCYLPGIDFDDWDDELWQLAGAKLEQLQCRVPKALACQRLVALPRLRGLRLTGATDGADSGPLFAACTQMTRLERIQINTGIVPKTSPWSSLAKLPHLRRVDLGVDPDPIMHQERLATARRELGARIELVVR